MCVPLHHFFIQDYLRKVVASIEGGLPVGDWGKGAHFVDGLDALGGGCGWIWLVVERR